MSSFTRTLFFCLFWLFTFTEALPQAEIKKLPANINRASINLYAPFISGDGRTIVYLSDYTDDGHHAMRWTTKKTVSTWNEELDVNKLINRPTLNFRGGYSLSFDGDMLLFTSRKSGLGGFDLWYSSRRGNDWEAPSNFGSPVNSGENEGAPMLSPDGEYLYFMRCSSMSEYGGASGCRILISKKSHNGWEEPKELPANINTGNSQTPRILADGETLIFASDQFGGKGGLDLFMTSKQGESWSDPVPMDFINTEENDQFISIPAKGRYLYADRKGPRSRELVQILIPDEFQPKKVMRVQGAVTGASGVPLNANLTVFNIDMRDRLWNEKTGPRGEFAIVLKEGAAYDVSVDTDDPSYMYFSKVYNLRDEVGPRDKDRLQIQLSPMQKGAVYSVPVTFEAHSSTIADISTFELRRIGEVLRKNPGMRIELSVHQPAYREDSVQSDPDLTELMIDSVIVQVERPVAMEEMETVVEDEEEEMETAGDDEYEVEETEADSLVTRAYEEEDIDTVAGSLANEPEIKYEIVEELQIRRIWHNDRTQQQGEAIREYLIGRGVAADRITVSASSAAGEVEDPGAEEKTEVKVEMKILDL